MPPNSGDRALKEAAQSTELIPASGRRFFFCHQTLDGMGISAYTLVL